MVSTGQVFTKMHKRTLDTWTCNFAALTTEFSVMVSSCWPVIEYGFMKRQDGRCRAFCKCFEHLLPYCKHVLPKVLKSQTEPQRPLLVPASQFRNDP